MDSRPPNGQRALTGAKTVSQITETAGGSDWSLPPGGGTVLLMEGHYYIKAVGGTLGGVLIDRSYVTLEGVGLSTRLRLSDSQNTNVIRIAGSGTRDIVVQNLYIDGNSDNWNSD